MRVKIVSTARYLPPRIETSVELAKHIGVSVDWIYKHTGVHQRHVSEEGMAQMGARAGRAALGDGPRPDLIINASGVPQQVLPDSSVYIQDAMGFEGIPSFSVHATCLSFPVALHNASALIHAGAFRRILVVSSELGTRGRNFKEPESASLFADGAAAVVVEPTPEGEASEVLAFEMSTWPKGADLTEVRGGGTRNHPHDPTTRPEHNLFHMDGPGVYRMALRRIPLILGRIYKRANITVNDVKLLILHQASGPAVDAAARFGFRPENVIKRVHEEGNCVAASIPMVLAHAHREGRLQRGDLVLLFGTGAGLSVAGLLLRW